MSGTVRQAMRGATKEQMIRRREASGDEMAKLARIANDPKADSSEVTDYLRELLRKGHIEPEEAARLASTVPHDPEALRAWARNAFSMVMHQGIHAHAAFPRELYPSPQQQAAPQQGPPQQAMPQQSAPSTPVIQ
jgi:hypothetical protein